MTLCSECQKRARGTCEAHGLRMATSYAAEHGRRGACHLQHICRAKSFSQRSHSLELLRYARMRRDHIKAKRADVPTVSLLADAMPASEACSLSAARPTSSASSHRLPHATNTSWSCLQLTCAAAPISARKPASPIGLDAALRKNSAGMPRMAAPSATAPASAIMLPYMSRYCSAAASAAASFVVPTLPMAFWLMSRCVRVEMLRKPCARCLAPRASRLHFLTFKCCNRTQKLQTYKAETAKVLLCSPK